MNSICQTPLRLQIFSTKPPSLPHGVSKRSFFFSLPSSPSHCNSTAPQWLPVSGKVASMSYDKQLDAAKKAACLAGRLCQKVQRALSPSDVQSKSDKSPVTVADYGSQAIVCFILEKDLPSVSFSLVAEEIGFFLPFICSLLLGEYVRIQETSEKKKARKHCIALQSL